MLWLRAVYTIIRLPNLVFIFLTQIFVYYFLIAPALLINVKFLGSTNIFLLALSTTLIAAAGYIINDYFDIKIDEINKPNRVTVEIQFKRRWIMGAHIMLNLIALGIAIPIALYCKHLSLIGIQILCILYLVAYSAQLKREPITGNVCIAILTGLLVLTPALYEHAYLKLHFSSYHFHFYTTLFFAFSITWLREIAKDLEDLKGDAMQGCQTMPIKFGLRVTKYCMYIISVSIVIVAIMKLLLIQNNVQYSYAILICTVMPTLYLLFLIYKCKNQKQFAQISFVIKLITFAGILITCLIT